MRASLVAQMVKNAGRSRFDPWVGNIPWRRKWQPTLVFFAGKSHGQRTLEGYSPWGCRVRHNWLNNKAKVHTWKFKTFVSIDVPLLGPCCRKWSELKNVTLLWSIWHPVPLDLEMATGFLWGITSSPQAFLILRVCWLFRQVHAWSGKFIH